MKVDVRRGESGRRALNPSCGSAVAGGDGGMAEIIGIERSEDSKGFAAVARDSSNDESCDAKCGAPNMSRALTPLVDNDLSTPLEPSAVTAEGCL